MELSRRQFLALAAVLALAGCESSSDETAIPAGISRIFDIGLASQFTADGVYGEFRSHGFFIVRHGDRFFALSSICKY